VRLPRSASQAVGLWPQRNVTGKQATALGVAFFIPGGFTLTASVIAAAILLHAGKKGLERSGTSELTREEAIEQKCFRKAENLLRRKISPIRITNTLVREDDPETLQICLFKNRDFLEFFPVGGLNGPGVAFCDKGCEVSLRPPISEDVFKLKVFRPTRFINEALITITDVRRGDRLIIASSPLDPKKIVIQRI